MTTIRCSAVVFLSVIALASCLDIAPLYRASKKVGDRHTVVLERHIDIDAFAGEILEDAVLFDRRPVIIRKLRSALNAIIVDMDEDVVNWIRSLKGVEFVEEDDVAYLESENWGLDRIDQRELPLSNTPYSSGSGYGDGANIFIIDSGVRTSHVEFEGRAKHSANFISSPDTDCHGHGSHCAGIAAGKTYGVAKKANVHSVKIFDCDGASTFSAIASGVDHVTEKKTTGMEHVIASMSLSANSVSVTRAVEGALYAGVVVVTSSGNNNYDACNLVPGNIDGVITVGNTQIDDTIRDSSNHGTCVDILAPGTNIVSCGYRTDTSAVTKTGTSMACPHVAGAAAILLADRSVHPFNVRNVLVSEASSIPETPTDGTPNKLLYVRPT